MARRKYRILKFLGWIVLSIISMFLLITLGFYLGRGWILDRAVYFLNENQPGEVQLGQMNLIPFMNFPDVSLKLRNVSYFEKDQHPDSLIQEPILYLNEVFIMLDAVELIRGNLQVSEIGLKDGFLRVEKYEDSITNIEKALGLSIFKEDLQDSELDSLETGMPVIKVNLDKIGLSNMLVIFEDRTSDDHLHLVVNQLNSSFSYLPERIDASLELNVDINSVKYLTYKEEVERNILFESVVSMRPGQKIILVEPSRMEVSGLKLEIWGTYDYMDKPKVNFEFRARNEGLEVLNYIFRGLLDIDEIEQIGSGSIQLTGNIKGVLDTGLPIISMSGNADQIGFRIKSIQEDVTGISFDLFATNGSKPDLSEAMLKVENFSASFPEGSIRAHLSACNVLAPELKIDIDGEVNLLGLEEMFQTELISQLEGNLAIEADIEGVVNRETGNFLNDKGFIRATMHDVGCIIHSDSVETQSVKHLNGEIFLQEHTLGTRDFVGEYNGNQLHVGFRSEDLLLYLLGFEKDVHVELNLSSDLLNVASLTQDTTVTSFLGEELRDLHFQAGALITHQELDDFMNKKSIPELEFSLDTLSIELPLYADISDMNASLTFGPDTIAVHSLHGMLGKSEFNFSGLIANYGALTGQDSLGTVTFGFDISSLKMRAEDFLTVNDEFLLPVAYNSEYLADFHLAGSIEVPAEGLLNESLPLDFDLNIQDLGLKLRHYPLAFEKFIIQVQRKGDRLVIEEFQGQVGENNIKMSATLENFTDTVVEHLKGDLVLKSDLLDFNQLLNYQLPEEVAFQEQKAMKEPLRLDQIAYPQFNFTLEIGELHYGEFNFYDLKGRLGSSGEKTFYLDQLTLAVESGGTISFSGEINVADPYMYTFSTELDLHDINVDDLDIEMQSGDEIYTLKENFDGLVSANGMAEIFVTPDLKVDMASTTAIFNVRITDGALINFTPLQAAAKYLDNKDLNHVKFATLQNSFPLTLMDSRINVPLMIVESTVGQMLIEGEQGLDNSYMYLLRIPPKLVRSATKSVFTNARDKEMEDQIQQMKRGNFYMMTVWSNGIESDFKLGDKRSKFEE